MELVWLQSLYSKPVLLKVYCAYESPAYLVNMQILIRPTVGLSILYFS